MERRPTDQRRPTNQRWLTSSYSAGGQCVAAQWRKSTASCSTNSCVEATAHPSDGTVVVRDSKDPDGPTLHYAEEDWAHGQVVYFQPLPAGPRGCCKEKEDVAWIVGEPMGTHLHFTDEERSAYMQGVVDNEFTLIRLQTRAENQDLE